MHGRRRPGQCCGGALARGTSSAHSSASRGHGEPKSGGRRAQRTAPKRLSSEASQRRGPGGKNPGSIRTPHLTIASRRRLIAYASLQLQPRLTRSVRRLPCTSVINPACTGRRVTPMTETSVPDDQKRRVVADFNAMAETYDALRFVQVCARRLVELSGPPSRCTGVGHRHRHRLGCHSCGPARRPDRQGARGGFGPRVAGVRPAEGDRGGSHPCRVSGRRCRAAGPRGPAL